VACDGLILTSIVPTLILEAVGPVLALESPAPELSLSSDSCILSFPVDIRLTFEVSSPSLELASAPVNLCMTSPVPVGVGEANEAVNCGTGAGVYRDKQGVTLRFRTLQSLTLALTVAENDPECSIDLDIDVTQVLRWNMTPAGLKDGLNLIYSLAEAVLPSTFRLYRNGIRQLEDVAGSCDFTLSESGGVGTGYDRITITAPALLDWELLTADYAVSA